MNLKVETNYIYISMAYSLDLFNLINKSNGVRFYDVFGLGNPIRCLDEKNENWEIDNLGRYHIPRKRNRLIFFHPLASLKYLPS